MSAEYLERILLISHCINYYGDFSFFITQHHFKDKFI